MQIILSKEECETINEALITEIEELKKQLKMERRKGRGELEKEYIKKAEAMMERFSQYV